MSGTGDMGPVVLYGCVPADYERPPLPIITRPSYTMYDDTERRIKALEEAIVSGPKLRRKLKTIRKLIKGGQKAALRRAVE